MKNVKKILCVLFSALLTLSFAACSNTKENGEDKISIVATVFSEYDWIREIVKNSPADIELSLLLDSGTDLHNYQPTAEDILKISDCDMFVYVGGESDKWVEDVLRQAQNDSMITVNLFDVLSGSIKEEEFVEGMEHEEHDDDDDESEHLHEGDEHVWLSLSNAEDVCEYLCKKICELDRENEKLYNENTENYCEKLDTLDDKYEDAVENAKVKTLLFADRFPFRYLTEDYSLEYYAAFSGCSAESEASFETVAFLAGKIDELNLKTVLTIEGSDKSIAQTVINTTKNKDAKILTLDSMQTKTLNDISNGATYLSIMESNLEILKEALN